MRKVRVALGEESYDILIGYGLEKELQSFVQGAGFSKQAMLVTDSNVGPLYGEKVRAILEAGGLHVTVVTIPAGESSKCLAVAEKLYTRAIELGLDRKSPIFALGGGVVGDLAGFIAATYMRGVPFVQLPTSLLAQVDSSVGGKVAVNHALGKNLIGAFYQPKGVFMDLSMMESLPKREIATGLGEIIKYGIIYDADFFAYLEQHADAVLALEREAAVHMIARSCEIKAAVVSEDEKESGLRRILNFGHTMAHAIEKETGYLRYNHGEAVAIGMIGAADISARLGNDPRGRCRARRGARHAHAAADQGGGLHGRCDVPRHLPRQEDHQRQGQLGAHAGHRQGDLPQRRARGHRAQSDGRAHRQVSRRFKKNFAGAVETALFLWYAI